MDTGSNEWVGWLAAILTGGIAGYVARQKGYSFWAWCFAGCNAGSGLCDRFCSKISVLTGLPTMP